MKRTLRGLAVAAVLSLPAASSAEAQAICGGNLFKTCASVSISSSNLGGGVWQIAMTVKNLSGTLGTYASTVFTAIGIWGQSSFSYVSGSLNSTGSGNWGLGNDNNGSVQGLSGSGIGSKVIGVKANQGINGGISAGQTANITFRINTSSAPDLTNWAIHGQGGPSGCSTKLVVDNGVGNQDWASTSQCETPPVEPPPTVTPEPASMILLGSGLAGIAGVVRRRRRTIA